MKVFWVKQLYLLCCFGSLLQNLLCVHVNSYVNLDLNRNQHSTFIRKHKGVFSPSCETFRADRDLLLTRLCSGAIKFTVGSCVSRSTSPETPTLGEPLPVPVGWKDLAPREGRALREGLSLSRFHACPVHLNQSGIRTLFTSLDEPASGMEQGVTVCASICLCDL